MKIEFGPAELDLVPNHPLRLLDAFGLLITCTSGMIWITLDGEADDIFLSAGEQYSVQRNGLTLVESIDQGKISIALVSAETTPRGHFRRMLHSLPAIALTSQKTTQAGFA